MLMAFVFLVFVSTVIGHWAWTEPNSYTVPVVMRAHTVPNLRSRNRFAMATPTSLQQQYPAHRQTALTKSLLAGNVLPIFAPTAANQTHDSTTIATAGASNGVVTTENGVRYISNDDVQIEFGVEPSIVRPAMVPSVSKGPQKESGNKKPTSMPPVHKDEKDDEDEDGEEEMNEEGDEDSCGNYDNDDGEDDEEDEDDEDYEDDDVRIAALAPTRPNARRGHKSRKRYLPRLKNFFPVIFSLPRPIGVRRGSSSSSQVPRLIAAVANSYSSTMGGIASSIATAYGLPTKRPRRKVLKNRVKTGTIH